MKKRILPLLLALTLLLGLLPGTAGAAGTLAAETTYNNGHPYYIMVNRDQNVVTVFGLDDNGYYTVPVRAMLCSTGVIGHRTPIGNFTTSALRKEWGMMFDGNWGQYTTQFNGNMLFHSVCYSRKDPSSLLAFEYNDLGKLASSGCIRLQVADAKWVYENCEPGTVVTVYESEDPGPLGKPEKPVPEMTADNYNGWEPSDPRPENPWHEKLVTALTVEEDALSLTVGEGCQLHWSVEKGSEVAEEPSWSSSDPAVASVDASGSVLALGAGEALLTLRCGSREDSVTVTVTGEALPFTDLKPGAWYYPDVRWALETGTLRGMGDGLFAPNTAVSRAMALQVLFNMRSNADAPEVPDGSAWYVKAAAWATRNGISTGGLNTPDSLERPITRQEFAQLLHRFSTGAGEDGRSDPTALLAYPDRAEVYAFAEEAMAWAVGKGILNGSDAGLLQPHGFLTRAQLAAILRRYKG